MNPAGVKKVLVIGSGPIVIGQAAEFDYSGTQCCRALKEEGVEVVLVNSNPATIQTDFEFADRIYIEPLTRETVEAVIERERPDGVIATMAGQTGLNLAVQLRPAFEKFGVRVLGTPIESIELAENREKFAELVRRMGEPIPASGRAESLEEARSVLAEIGLPVIIRPDYCLGGTGTAIVHEEKEFDAAAAKALDASGTHSVLIERSLEGLAELEYEVVRDGSDNCITVCNMENLDPMGVHTGESIVVAPSQTLSDREYHLLRASAIRIIRALGVQGACNIQFALDQKSGEYFIVEVNPRTSRSSALASKATGYPIARIATKIALGYSLGEIENRITGKSAAFEPALDYCVVKVPKWPFEKLRVPRSIGTQMKSTGEVMAIGRSFEEALNKAQNSLEQSVKQLPALESDDEVSRWLRPNEWRLLVIRELLRSGRLAPAEVSKRTGIHPWFVGKLALLVAMERALESSQIGSEKFLSLLSEAKRLGFSDAQVASVCGTSAENVSFLRKRSGLSPVYKMVDTCAAEFPALTPYYYSTFEAEDESQSLERKASRKVVILGSGPIRIGQGIEFDYCTVHAVMALRGLGYETVVVNNNPETVSTDFDVAGKLYFEPLSAEHVLSVLEREAGVEGVVVQFGGQTAVNLALPLSRSGVRVLGTSVESIDRSQDRKRFKSLLRKLKIPAIESAVAFSREEALEISGSMAFPLLVRPSYVLGGRAMEIVYDAKHLSSVVDEAIFVSGNYAIILDRFLEDAIEIDVDALCDGTRVKIAGIMEQVEEAGVHSGDSCCVIPPVRVSAGALAKVAAYTRMLCTELGIVGLVNIQMAVQGDEVYVLEVNPRASRTVPYLSKATGVPIAKIAACLQVGRVLDEFFDDLDSPLAPPPGFFAVKAPVFPFSRFPEADPVLSPEMKSTGEVMGLGSTFEEAFLKAMRAAGNAFGRAAYVGECGKWRKSITNAFKSAGIQVFEGSVAEGAKLVREGRVSFVVDGIRSAAGRSPPDARKAAVAKGIPCITGAFAAIAIARALAKAKPCGVLALNDLPHKPIKSAPA
ncbi:MAG: carbamoyl-phosphate synthase large subunit [Candidatus Micrarchaeota archaeon]